MDELEYELEMLERTIANLQKRADKIRNKIKRLSDMQNYADYYDQNGGWRNDSYETERMLETEVWIINKIKIKGYVEEEK